MKLSLKKKKKKKKFIINTTYKIHAFLINLLIKI